MGWIDQTGRVGDLRADQPDQFRTLPARRVAQVELAGQAQRPSNTYS